MHHFASDGAVGPRAGLAAPVPAVDDVAIEDTPIFKTKPLPKGQRKPVVDEAPVEEAAPSVEMILDFTVVNDFLGIRLVNTDNEAAVRVAQAMGFKHPPAYFAAKMPRPRHLLQVFTAWKELGFEIDKENSHACSVAYKHFFANRNSAPNFYGVANASDIRNFYKMEFKPNPSRTHINPYPLMQDDELFLALPKNGHPGSIPAMQKARVAGVKWYAYDSESELIAFTPKKEKASVLIKSLLAQGVVIPNLKELAAKFRKLRIARDKDVE